MKLDVLHTFILSFEFMNFWSLFTKRFDSYTLFNCASEKSQIALPEIEFCGVVRTAYTRLLLVFVLDPLVSEEVGWPSSSTTEVTDWISSK